MPIALIYTLGARKFFRNPVTAGAPRSLALWSPQKVFSASPRSLHVLTQTHAPVQISVNPLLLLKSLQVAPYTTNRNVSKKKGKSKPKSRLKSSRGGSSSDREGGDCRRAPKAALKAGSEEGDDKDVNTNTGSGSELYSSLSEKKDGSLAHADRPFTLPPGQFKPKQSLGQNFLSDQNFVLKICNAFNDDSQGGKRVVEVGPGAGALSRVLYPRYPDMTAIEIDQRAVAFLADKLPGLHVIHQDVLSTDWMALAEQGGGPIRLIANLPYYIVSQVLFSLIDAPGSVEKAVVTMQLEVAMRICAKPNTKAYGIPSVVFQLYCAPKMNFKIPPTVFYPQPDVDSALLTLDFNKPNALVHKVHPARLRKVLAEAFQQRRKMLRVSLKKHLQNEADARAVAAGIIGTTTGEPAVPAVLGDQWATRRPESLSPTDWVHFMLDLYGEAAGTAPAYQETGKTVWRRDLTRD